MPRRRLRAPDKTPPCPPLRKGREKPPPYEGGGWGEVLCGGLSGFFLLLLVLAAGCGKTAVSAPSPHAEDSNSPAGNASAALFEDVTTQAGIRFVHENGAKAGKLYFLETTPPGCAFFDYDNDDWLDILLIQSGSVEKAEGGKESGGGGETRASRAVAALYHNNRNGTFTEVTAGSGLDKAVGYGHGIAVGDYDNDGYDDLFLTAFGRNFLFHNARGTGKFVEVTRSMGLDKLHSTGYATSAAFGDYDNDGRLDLYVCYYCPWTVQADKACRDAQGNREYCSPEVYPADMHVLYHNAGNRFVDVSAAAGITKVKGRGLAVAFLDYDEDGRQDIFVANDLSGNMLWHNEGRGKFVEKGTEVGCRYGSGGVLMAGMGIALADYDRSGHESLFVTNFEAMPNMLFKNQGDGFLEDMTVVSQVGLLHLPFLSFGCEFLDYDADGWPDLLIANGHVQLNGKGPDSMKQRKQLLHNEGTGRFRDISEPAQLGALNKPTVARGLAVGDFDNDGRLDALFSNQNDSAQLFRNRDRSRNHWVSFKTIGTKSNRDGLHARFVLQSGQERCIGSVRAGSSYLSVSDRRVYFGLGARDKIDRVEIFWPSGVHETLTDVAPDASYIVTEGKGITGKLPASPSP